METDSAYVHRYGAIEHKNINLQAESVGDTIVRNVLLEYHVQFHYQERKITHPAEIR